MGRGWWPVALAALVVVPLAASSESSGAASGAAPAAASGGKKASSGGKKAAKGADNASNASEAPAQRYIPERHLGVPLAGDKCDCLNWKDLFDLGRVWCGEGNEFFRIKNKSGHSKLDLLMMSADPSAPLHSVYQAVCDQVFKHMNHSMCVNIGAAFGWDPEDWRTGQWCYVPFSCRDLNGGARLKEKPVSWKICSRGRDKLTRDMHPDELFSYGVGLNPQAKTVLQVLLSNSYTYLRPDIWWDIKKKWRRRDFKRLPLMLREAMLANVPMVVETAPPRLAHAQAKRVVYNGTLWNVECVEPKESCVVKEEHYDWPERFV
mmetsp:Transcript_22139/g.50602  ORF Transcript_22139/g.50602 Transcript_22139/m.50602 type:complete len:320 (+) Transcript_22139:54-1013(+)